LVNYFTLRTFSRNTIDNIIEQRKRLIVTYLINWLILCILTVIQAIFNPVYDFSTDLLILFAQMITVVFFSAFLFPFLFVAIPYYLISLPFMPAQSFVPSAVGVAVLFLFIIIYYFVSQRIDVNPELDEMGKRTALLINRLVAIWLEIWLLQLIIMTVLFFMLFIYITFTGQSSTSESIDMTFMLSLAVLPFYLVIMILAWLDTIDINPLTFIRRRRKKDEAIKFSKRKGSLMTSEQELRNRLYLLQTVQRTSLGSVSFDKLKTVLGVNTTDELLKFLEKINGKRINVYHFKFQVNEKKRSVHFTAG